MTEIVLVTRNARDKVQVVITSLEQDGNVFYINRTTGQYGNKMTNQVRLCIEKGKAKRTVLQQAESEFNSIVNKYLDKGYKRLDSLTNKKFELMGPLELDEVVPVLKTDSNGKLKPQLAKSSNDCKISVLEKEMACSKKLDGVRCTMEWNEDDVDSVSRGGKDYNASTALIRKELFSYLKANPTMRFDGELYVHGKPLQEISGIARLTAWEDRCEILEYWIYDLAIPDMKFRDRLKILMELQEKFSGNAKIKIIDHVFTSSWMEIDKLHNQWVEEGFEGLVARKPDKNYSFGKRNSDWIKVKLYQDEEFKIIDYKDGLRPEDFAFILETKEGKVFSACPVGTREQKAQYILDMDDIIDNYGTVKFFGYSTDGIPMQPHFKSVRYSDDM